MPYDHYLINRIKGAVRARDVSKVEDLWVEIQSSGLEELKPFLDIASEVADRGDRERAAELLLLLRDDLKSAEREDELFDVLRQAVRYSGRVRGVRDDLVAQYRRAYGDRPGFEAILSRTDLAGEGKLRDAVETLDQAFAFTVGDFVFHSRGWGVGKVVEANPEAGEFVIDFARRRGQRMEAGMALKALERRGADDLDVLLWTDKDKVRELAKEDPLGLLKSALSAAGGKLQSRDLREKLTDILEKSAWTKFWSKARKLAKEDPQIEVGPAPRSVISLRDEPLSRDEELIEKVRKAREFGVRIELAHKELQAIKKDAPETPPEWVAPILEYLDKNHGKKGSTKQLAAALELALFKDGLARLWPDLVPGVEPAPEGEVDPETGEPLPTSVAEHLRDALAALVADNAPELLSAMALAESRRKTIALLPLARPDEAPEMLRAILLDPPHGTWMAATRALKGLSRDDVINACANQVVIKPTDYPEAYAALAKARLTGQLDVLADRRDSSLVAKAIKLLDALSLQHKETSSRKEKAQLKTTVDALRTMFADKTHRILQRLIEGGTEDDVRRVLLLTRQSPALSETVKRGAETAIAEHFPDLLRARLERAEDEEDGPILFSTAEGIKRREAELDHLMNVEYEKVRLEIGKALEFGDISENSELDAARERQHQIAERAQRMRDELDRVKVIDAQNVDTTQVSVGARVTVEGAGEGQTHYTILGPWDISDADPSVISHLAPMAQGLLGKRVGDQAVVKLPDKTEAEYTIVAIENAVLQEQESA